MIQLSGKQKRFLRSQANTMNPIFSVGKNGMTQTWVDEIVVALNKRELVKVNVQQSADVTVKEVAQYIEDHSNITVVQTIGKTLVLYLPAINPKYAKLSLLVNDL
ncbi:ribosome assembly RNA-binding protein YhbY [Leuconostoc fallax]|uniref:CRM domain-containing protein n=1 Tax=Leuconostoc fallax TaxID=1251 RepID=A0A4R5NB32_9LACO|nr:ribosome assembly RNA-binding protein YhbY [Leuconostoc fallax]MBU7455117.1 ribosome assembly RNA-binding protein YhbY [Leuconostoc fallax]MCO6183392.1 ribosome assembly RNA-binding protein YhbY [Leuconostoc fallax]TDG69682.1 hypothetical protein C5L23_001144 [Leuconostoc fallax]